MNGYGEQGGQPRHGFWAAVVFFGLFCFVVLVAVGMVGCPMYNVYEQRKAGEAALAHAQSSKEVAVAEAKARQESAVFDKQASITAAEAVAESNKIIGDSLKNNEDYLKYLWITDTLGKNADKQVIYVATEANVPIMEAGRTATRPQP